MVIYDCLKVDLFGRCMDLYYLMGIVPELPKEKKKRGYVYKIYALLLYCTCYIFDMFEFIKLGQNIMEGENSLELVITNCMIASLHLAGLLHSRLGKSKKGGEYLQKVIDFERKLYASRNKKLIDLYKRKITDFRTTSAGYFSCALLAAVFYCSSSLIRPKQLAVIGNATYAARQLPAPILSPFNHFTQFTLSYLWSISIGSLLSLWIVAGDLICFGYTIFALCQLEVLKHFITDFFEKAKEIQQYLNCDEIESYRILQRECIIMHQDIIRYIEDLNSQLKYLMLIDFLPGSIEMAAFMYQLMNNLNLFQMVFIGEFIATLTFRLFLYCVNANKLNVESQEIGKVWYQLDWTGLPKDMKKNITICIARTQKPLSITVGDFQEVSLVIFISIMKGAYTYMMFLTTV